jgi:U3 small nucleolar RNA-associated protein 22
MLKTGTLHKSMTAFQMLKVAFAALGSHDFSTPLRLASMSEKTEPTSEEFTDIVFADAFDISIIDPSGTTNIVAHVSKPVMCEFQYEAALASKLMTNETIENFDALFLQKVDLPLLKYDNVFRYVSLTPASPELSELRHTMNSQSWITATTRHSWFGTCITSSQRR